MPQPPDAPPESRIPLCVDLDGTLIKTDLLWESLARLLRRNPFGLPVVLFWWMRGRAFLKKQLARRVTIDPAALPYNGPFIAFLRAQKKTGRKLVLATASDRRMALPVADHIGLFDEIVASDGKTNLRASNKLKALVEKFGERGFDYAGNSHVDLAVWRGAREAIVVNAPSSLVKRASQCAKLGPVFTENYSPFSTLKCFLNEFFIRSGYLVAIIAGLFLTAAFPKTGIAGFAWIAPALLLFAASGKSSGDAFRAGYAAGLAHFLSSLYWLLLMPVAGFPVLAWISLAAYLAIYPAIWLWLTAGISSFRLQGSSSWSRRTLGSLAGAAVWVALDMVRARLFSGFPWNFIGVSQFKLVPLIQIASITGVYGVSFMVVWTSLSLFSAARVVLSKPASRFAWQSEIILPLLAVTAVFAFGLARLHEERQPAPTLRVTLIQPAIPQTMIWDENANSNRFEQVLALSEHALTNKTDLLVWPESALPEFDDASYAAITNLLCTHRVWMIFNADDRPDAKSDDFNAAFLFGPGGGCAGIYHKQNLVIFGEYIPLVRWLPFIKWFTPITGGFEAGDEPGAFELGDLKINTAPLICFEDTFPQLARKSVRDDTDFLVNLTNDGWFGQSAEQWQHMANAVFRAVENGVPLVRCANNGVTCQMDARGRIRDIFMDKTGDVYGAGAMTIELPLPKHVQTFYNRHGDWFGWLCAGISLVALGFKIKRRSPSCRPDFAQQQ